MSRFEDYMSGLKKRREGMIAYIILKINDEDWHGVADAAMDLREIDASIKALLELGGA